MKAKKLKSGLELLGIKEVNGEKSVIIKDGEDYVKITKSDLDEIYQIVFNEEEIE